MKKWDGKIYRPAKAGRASVGILRTVLNEKPRTPRRRKKYAQMRTEKDRGGFERNPKWEKPTLLVRIWDEIRHILFPPPRRF
jgi:hypothetical protein